MTTIRWAILFFGLLGLLWFLVPIIIKLFDKNYRAELKKQMQEEEKKKTKEQKEKEERRWHIWRWVFFWIGLLIYTLLSK